MRKGDKGDNVLQHIRFDQSIIS